ncbi:cystathionine beta-lyase family protein involved in aluminum resistance [Clostridium sp. CAG:1000]|nr:cystathionine beta-lyase family protein involved in aluminum resistance [Clostridium sp. CAG:1000]
MLKIDKNIERIVNTEEQNLKDIFNKIDDQTLKNSKKVLDSFHKHNLSSNDLYGTNGYGYNDIGRDKIDSIFADIFNAESGLVRNQFISGSHAITIVLQALLRPNDTLLSITDTPYDTLHEVIGIKDNNSSLISYGVNYKEIDLIDNDFDYESIKEELNNNIKVIHIQRSRGYSTRESLDIKKVEKVIKLIKDINKDIIIFVDNCYCEFVEDLSPIDVGADIMVGSLIKNLGAGIATNGAYIVGNKNLVDLCAERLTLPGEGREVGPSFEANRMFLLGLYFAPSVVSSALKTSILTSKVLEKLGYKVSPKYNDIRCDIVQLIYFNNEDEIIKYAQGIQSSGPIDSYVKPIPSDMPGYDNKIIMASPSFTSGSSIELSADGPLRKPYVLYQQGALSYEYGKLALINTLSQMNE